MSEKVPISSDSVQEDLLRSFHEQFSSNQNHHQSILRDAQGNLASYSIVHLILTYVVVEFVLVLLGSLVFIVFSFRRDQKVVFNIRQF